MPEEIIQNEITTEITTETTNEHNLEVEEVMEEINNVNNIYESEENNNQEAEVHTTVATENGHAPSTETSGGVLGSLGINGQLFGFQLLNFAIVVGIVWFLILKPLTKKMDERRKIIDESLEKAKEVENQFLNSQLKFQEKIDEAKTEANRIIQDAREEAVFLGDKMKEKAKVEIEILVNQAKRNLEIDRKDMEEKLKRQTVEIAILTAEKIIGEKIDLKKDEKFINEIIKTVK